jgi:hypothetical protein
MDFLDSVKEDWNLLATWGVTVTLAYLLTPLLGANPLGLNYTVESQIVVMWFVLMGPPIAQTFSRFLDDRNWKDLHLIWAVVVIAGLLGNVYGIASITDEMVLFISYYQKWFLLPAVAFGLSAYMLEGFSRKVYSVSAVLNGVYGAGLFAVPALAPLAFPVAALIQGVPMMVDWNHFR